MTSKSNISHQTFRELILSYKHHCDNRSQCKFVEGKLQWTKVGFKTMTRRVGLLSIKIGAPSEMPQFKAVNAVRSLVLNSA